MRLKRTVRMNGTLTPITTMANAAVSGHGLNQTSGIQLAIEIYSGHMTEVARRLGIGRSTLYRKVREQGLEGAINEAM